MLDPFSSQFAWPAPAKLNLFLHITARRQDGYHELQTVFQFLDYGDSLYFRPRGDGVCQRIEGPADVVPEQDLAVRAAQALSAASGCGLGADIRLIKRIPVGSGLGGGSSDAATALVALNRLWNLGFPIDELIPLGLKLGADVPVFLRAHASWAEGVGERLRDVEPPCPWYLVVTPVVHVPTAEIFKAPELERDLPRADWVDFVQGRTRNVCEPVTTARYPDVGEALRWLSEQAQGARMSGTGGSVFAAFTRESEAQAACNRVPKQWKAFVAKGLNRSPLADIMRGL